MPLTIGLPEPGGRIADYTLSEPKRFAAPAGRPLNRIALAAAHVVADPLADVDPWLAAAPDWDRTIGFREHLWSLGLGGGGHGYGPARHGPRLADGAGADRALG